MAKKITCKKCKKEIKVFGKYKYKGNNICSQCKSDAVGYTIPGYDSGSVDSDYQGSPIHECSKCKRLMGGNVIWEDDKPYCQMCSEDEKRRKAKKIKCSKCGNEFAPVITTNGDDSIYNYGTSAFRGRLCPRCIAIEKHNDVVSAGRSLRKKIGLDKGKAEKRKSIKPSPKSRFQSIIEDRKRVIQLIKERNM